jgi:4-amino-4-deoxy-L-arabinose transferase-like glycosyltransferase
VAIGWLIAMLATALFGSNAGLVAGLLWLANPFVLGIGHLDGIDMPATLTTVLAALAVLHARRNPTRGRIIIVGLCAGLAVLARVSGLLVIATAAFALFTPQWREQRDHAVWRAAVVVGTAWLTVMAAYAVLSPVDILGHGAPLHAAMNTIGNVLVPPEWLRGTSYLLHDGNNPGASFLLGLQHTGAWALFVPGSLFVKLPPTTLAVLIVGPLAWLKLPGAARRDAAVVVAVPAIAHTLFTMQQARPIGLRYELPALALALVAASAIVHAITPRVLRALGAVVVGVGALACSAGPALAWTNPLLGPGYRQAADSNLDWGEAFPALARWSPSHHPWVEVFSSPGLGNAAVPGARDLTTAPASTPITGWVAVSASELTVYDRHDLAWLRAYCPVRVLDGSVLVYRFSSPPDRRAAGPETPALPCTGGTSVRLDASAGEAGS